MTANSEQRNKKKDKFKKKKENPYKKGGRERLINVTKKKSGK
jgi:hypothetical protein